MTRLCHENGDAVIPAHPHSGESRNPETLREMNAADGKNFWIPVFAGMGVAGKFLSSVLCAVGFVPHQRNHPLHKVPHNRAVLFDLIIFHEIKVEIGVEHLRRRVSSP